MSGEDTVSLDGLVGELLSLDPAALRILGCEQPTTLDEAWGSVSRIGLNKLLRRVLTLCETVLDDENAVIKLETDASARAAGWPDARTANVAMLLAWGMIGEDRNPRGLPFVPLLAADASISVPTQQRRVPDPRPTAALVQAIARIPEVSRERFARGAALWANPEPHPMAVPATNALIREVLGLDPRVLATAVDGRRRRTRYSFDANPEMAGWAGLNALLWDAIVQYETMRSRATEEVRLMNEEEARDGGRPDARSANFATLLSAGLMGEDGWIVQFFPARPFSQQREDLLRAMALEVRRSGSLTAREGFRLVCDDMVFFGLQGDQDKGSRLLDAV